MKEPLTRTLRRPLARSRHFLGTLAAAGLAVSMATTGAGMISAAPAQCRQLASSHDLGRRCPRAQVKAYEKAFPNVKVNLVTFDAGANGSGSIESKVALFNRVGHGWPDIVFSAEQNDVQKLGVAPFNFPAVLNKGGLVPDAVIKNYASGALDPCYIGKQLECLRNDLAFDVLWVNVPLMKQFGYTVPTTWQQWQSDRRETWPRTTPATSSARSATPMTTPFTSRRPSAT